MISRCFTLNVFLNFKRKSLLVLILSILISDTAFGQWTRKADEISKRAESNNVLYKNKLYVFGGFGDNPIIEKTNEVYDIAANKWSKIASFPVGKEVTHQGVILVDDKVWLIGGRLVDAYGPASSHVLIYNITTNTWSDGPELIDPDANKVFPIGAAGYALLGRTIHVFGGFGPTLCEDQANLHLTIDVDKYMADPQHVTWENKLAPMPIPRNHLSSVVIGGKIYALGGQFLHDCGAVDKMYCHVYDSATDTWTRLTDLPKPRSHAEAATFAVDGKIFLVGGQSYNNLTQNSTYQFDPKANNGAGAWTNLSSYKLPGTFLGLSSKLAGTSFIITNGALDNYGNERKETYTAKVARSTARTLGFTQACISADVRVDSTAQIKNLLYCIEDTAPYTITSDVAWLSITKNQSGNVTLEGQDIHVAINPAGLAPGHYTGNITTKGPLANSTAKFCVNLNVLPSQQPKTQYALVVDTIGIGTIARSPERSTYDSNSVVNIIATPASGWLFKEWTGDTVATTNSFAALMDTSKHYTATFIKDTTIAVALISNIAATTNKSYVLGQLNTGVVYYSDRTYKITSVPSVLTGSPFIKTPNDDKMNTSTNILSFTLGQAATVYVAYDPRVTSLPTWLKSWKKLTDKIGIDDPKLSSLTLYSKDFAAGKVTIGGNYASPTAGTLCEYLVIGKVPAATASSRTALMSLKGGAFESYSATNTIDPQATVSKIQLYPNPVSDRFQVTFPANYKGASSVTIVDMNGKVYPVSKSVINNNTLKMDININQLSLKTGIYSVLVRSKEGKTDVVRFMVQ